MTENTVPQTLRAALEAEGSYDQVALLTEKTGNLEREDFIHYVNDVTLAGLTDGEKSILRKIAVMRVQSGQPLFPWNDSEFLNQMNLEFGGFVY